MKRTGALPLLVLAVIGLAVGSLIQVVLAQTGQRGFSPPLSLGIVLGVIGTATIALAWPIRRAITGKRRGGVDPFYATRVVVLAKSSAVAGALLGGIGAGSIVYLLSRTVPAVGSVGFSVTMLVGAIVLMVCGLVAELMCRLPPEDDDEEPVKTPA